MPRGHDSVQLNVVRQRHTPSTSLRMSRRSAAARERLTGETSSGALGFGAPAAHVAVPGLPFGGVGASGVGAYHGEHSVALFSHEKAVLSKPLRPDTLRVVYPPYTGLRERLVRRVVARLR